MEARMESRKAGMAGGTIGRGTAWAVQAGLLAMLMVPPAHAQTCAEPAAADFRVTPLVETGLRNPVHLAVAPDGRVFIAEMRTGEIRLYKPGSTGTTVAGTVPSRYDNEDGLLGITLHPKFAENGFLFALFTVQGTAAPAQAVMRYKVTGDVIGISGGVEVLRFSRVPGGKYHAAGGMAWDAAENLIIGTGDDTNPHDAPNDGYGAIYYKEPGKDAQKSASNTNDLRGKILRIKPVDPAVGGKYYTIPPGNLFPEGTAQTRPEILAMGARNPYRVSVHPVTGWVFFGEVGPDANTTNAQRGRMGHDEFNIVTTAGNFGWPYCNGNNFAYNNVDYSGATGVPGSPFDCASPVNNSPNNTGLKNLPASRAPMMWYAGNNSTDWKELGNGAETAMAGPVYQYDRTSTSTTKFPPQYDGRVMFWDWSRRVAKLITLESDGRYKSMVNFPNSNFGTTFGSVISAEYGKDGSLYILRYSKNGYSDEGTTGGLFRVDYTGARNETCLPTSLVARRGAIGAPARGALAGIPGMTSFEIPADKQGLEVFDLSGKRVFVERRNGRAGSLRVELPSGLASGLVKARFF